MALSATYKLKLSDVFERKANHMYLDSTGHVTLGYGHMLPTSNSAVNLPFTFRTHRFRVQTPNRQAQVPPRLSVPMLLDSLLPSTFAQSLGQPQPGLFVDAATPDEVRSDWTAVHSQPQNYKAPHYRQFTRCWLDDAAVEALHAADLAAYWKGLEKLLPEIESYPQAAQDALFDLYFNSTFGSAGTFPNLKAAVAARDWATAATLCHRKSIPENRNDFTKQCFLDAAAEVQAQSLARSNRTAAQADATARALGTPLSPKPSVREIDARGPLP